MKKTLCIVLLIMLLAGCGNQQAAPVESTVVETTAAATVPAETVPAETAVPEETEEILIPEEKSFYPSRRTVNGKEVYDFGMELHNDTDVVQTVVSMQVVDSASQEEVASRTYSGWEMDVFNGDRPANYTMEPGYPVVLFIEENVAAVTFDMRVVTVTLQSETGEASEQVFCFTVDDQQEALHPDPDEKVWNPAVQEAGSWKFPCEITNDTDQTLTFAGMYSLQYINGNAVRCSYRAPNGFSKDTTLEPGNSVVMTDGIAVKNMFATHRKYVVRFEDPQGNIYEKVFRFAVDPEA